jgi:hypothetical protein
MNDAKWTMLFSPFRTRTEVRNTLATTLAGLTVMPAGSAAFPAEINALATGNDREVMESLGRVKAFCESLKGADKKSVVASIARDMYELFSGALETMKKLPPEPIKPVELVAARQVRRA